MNMTQTAIQNRITQNGSPYVYASYVNNDQSQGGYVAVIDPTTDKIIKRISTGLNPVGMCLSPKEDKLYVLDDRKILFIYSTDTFNILGGTPVGKNPVAVFAEPTINKVYVANYDDGTITIVDAITNSLIKTVDLDPGSIFKVHPFAFAFRFFENSVLIACKRDDGSDCIFVMDTLTDSYYMVDFPSYPTPLKFDQNHNPLTVHPNGQTQVTFGLIGYLLEQESGTTNYKSTSLLDNTVSGIYLDNTKLFCTMRGDRDFLKVFENLVFDMTGDITEEQFFEIPSYKGQDKIRTTPSQKYVGVTIQPTDYPTGGLQIIDADDYTSRFVPLNIIGDMTMFSDTKAYVGEINGVRPIDLTNAKALPPISLGGYYLTLKNIISGYSKQSF
ncbi:YncE family protein [Paenibacillus piscarius]|uniref:YncE family protein n=1 Tax=Paenibacillus piscarius TaxID=1089681 RepID=UPI001EE99A8A|nr:hypothetical protein [Paenibacillus piscarius]